MDGWMVWVFQWLAHLVAQALAPRLFRVQQLARLRQEDLKVTRDARIRHWNHFNFLSREFRF